MLGAVDIVRSLLCCMCMVKVCFVAVQPEGCRQRGRGSTSDVRRCGSKLQLLLNKANQKSKIQK